MSLAHYVKYMFNLRKSVNVFIQHSNNKSLDGMNSVVWDTV